MICAISTYAFPSLAFPFTIGYVSSLATKLSDTFGSEIGKAYGKSTYLITTLKRVPRGTEGAVSIEGTVAGVVGSLLMLAAAVGLGLCPHPLSVHVAAAVIFSSFVATTTESYIGAIFQDKFDWLTNEFVNFINTTIGAVLAIAWIIAFA